MLEGASVQAFEHIPKVKADTDTEVEIEIETSETETSDIDASETGEKKKADKAKKKENKLKKKDDKPNKPNKPNKLDKLKTLNYITVQEPFFDRIIGEQLEATILIGRKVLKGTILDNQEYILIANIDGNIMQIQKGAISLVSIRKSFRRNFDNRSRTDFDNSENPIGEITRNSNKPSESS